MPPIYVSSHLCIHPLWIEARWERIILCRPSRRPLNKGNFESGLWDLDALGCPGVRWINTLSGPHGNTITSIRTGPRIASYKSRFHGRFCAFLSFPVRQLEIFHFLMMSSGICWWHNEGKCYILLATQLTQRPVKKMKMCKSPFKHPLGKLCCSRF